MLSWLGFLQLNLGNRLRESLLPQASQMVKRGI
jgi:hypothetical protein